MKRQNQSAPQFSAIALACGLVFSLLPGTAAAQDGADKRPGTETGLPDMPMKAPVENSLAHEVAQKPAVESKLLSDMESLDNREPWVDPRQQAIR